MSCAVECGTAEGGTAEILKSVFQRAADAINTLVHQCDGAMRIHSADLQAACEHIDDDLKACFYPDVVWKHVMCEHNMERTGGLCVVKAMEDDGAVVIYDPKIHEDPDSAQLYSKLLDMAPIAVG